MTIYYPDISGHQAGIDLRSALAVCCKATEGTGYTNPDYARAEANAASHGTFFFAYHFLHAGNAAAQARYCYSVTGKTPLMLDVEPTTADPFRTSWPAPRLRYEVDEWSLPLKANSVPTLADVTGFVDTYRKLGGIVHLTYLPHWYWQQLGSPSLSALFSRILALVSSAYTTYTDANSGTGWQSYGGMKPEVWQYTDAVQFNGFACDFNAFRGTHPGDQSAAAVADTLNQFKSLVRTGSIDPAPSPIGNPRPPYSEDSVMILDMLTHTGSAVCVPVPSGKSKILFFADPGFNTQAQPKLRVGFTPRWNGVHYVEPAWSYPKELTVPSGADRVTIGRMDDGNAIVTIDWA